MIPSVDFGTPIGVLPRLLVLFTHERPQALLPRGIGLHAVPHPLPGRAEL